MIDAQQGFLYLETGEIYQGDWAGGPDRAGEVVFNTAHSGYVEVASDPSYFSQIVVMTAPMMGNYGVSLVDQESERPWINGFICLQLQNSKRDSEWLNYLTQHNVACLHQLDTRKLVLRLREGVAIGALVQAQDASVAESKAKELIAVFKKQDSNWPKQVCVSSEVQITGEEPDGPRVAIVDFGCKKNIIREWQKRASKVALFPCDVSQVQSIRNFKPDILFLSNGPGDPSLVTDGPQLVREFLGQLPVAGICMGHQILGLALGGSTYKLKFGHRGINHPVKDLRSGKILITSQNHGYAVDLGRASQSVLTTHLNLNDQSVAGLMSEEHKCFSVQFHPECHPGPHDALEIFNTFERMCRR